MSGSDLSFPSNYSIDSNALRSNGNAWVQMGRSKYDGKVINFYWATVHNPAKSREAGMPVEDKEIFIEIFTPGEEGTEKIVRPITENDKREFPQHWAAFQQNRVHVPEGTPIEVLFPADPQIPKMLRYHGIHTVQLCAKMSPHAIETLGMGAQDWVNKAKRMIDFANEHKSEHLVEQLKQQHQNEINSLKNQIAELIQRMGSMQSAVATHVPAYAAAEIGRQLAGHVEPAPKKPIPEAPQWAEPPAGFIEEDNPPKIDLRTKEGRKLKAAREGSVEFTED